MFLGTSRNFNPHNKVGISTISNSADDNQVESSHNKEQADDKSFNVLSDLSWSTMYPIIIDNRQEDASQYMLPQNASLRSRQIFEITATQCKTYENLPQFTNYAKVSEILI